MILGSNYLGDFFFVSLLSFLRDRVSFEFHRRVVWVCPDFTPPPPQASSLRFGFCKKSLIEKKKKEMGAYLTSVDGWRAIGLLIVLVYHMNWNVRSGWLGIGMFFSVSGILITMSTIGVLEKKGQIGVLQFWLRRIVRLYPALFLFLFFLCIVVVVRKSGVFGHAPKPSELFFFRGDMLASLFFYENFHLIAREDDYFNDFEKPSSVRHIWTLAIEEQYYLVWPLLLTFWTSFLFPIFEDKNHDSRSSSDSNSSSSLPTDSRKVDPARLQRALWTLLFGELLVFCVSWWAGYWTLRNKGPSAAYFSTWCRAADFAGGGASFLLFRLTPPLNRLLLSNQEEPTDPNKVTLSNVFSEICNIALLGFLVSVCLPIKQQTLFPLFFGWLRPFISFGVPFCVMGSGIAKAKLPSWAIVGHFVNTKLMITIGISSYGIYVFHLPFVVWFSSSYQKYGFWEDWIRDIAVLIFCIILGTLSFYFYEKKMMGNAAKLIQGYGPWIIYAVAAVAMVALCFLILGVSTGAHDPKERISLSADARIQQLELQVRQLSGVVEELVRLSETSSAPTTAIQQQQHQEIREESKNQSILPVGRMRGLNPIRIGFWGNSQAQSLSDRVQEILEIVSNDLPSLQETNNSIITLPQTFQTVLLGKKMPMAYTFVDGPPPGRTGKERDAWQRESTRGGYLPKEIWLNKANQRDAVILVEGFHFSNQTFHVEGQKRGMESIEDQNYLKYAFEETVRQLAKTTTHNLFFLPMTPFSGLPAFHSGRWVYQWLEDHACTGDVKDHQLFFSMSLIDWPRLVCPTFPTAFQQFQIGDTLEMECPIKAHGFPRILPDQIHPGGKAGKWLTAQVLSLVLAQVDKSRNLKGENPFIRYLRKTYPFDNDPVPLEQLIITRELCVN